MPSLAPEASTAAAAMPSVTSRTHTPSGRMSSIRPRTAMAVPVTMSVRTRGSPGDVAAAHAASVPAAIATPPR
ncbi:MAG TPA: hypothetical protein VIX86_01610 [Streptosporangiaceae bacterium]